MTSRRSTTAWYPTSSYRWQKGAWLIDDRDSRKFRGCPTARARRLNAELRDQISEDYLSNMKRGLARWVKGGERGYLAWGIFSFRKLSRS